MTQNATITVNFVSDIITSSWKDVVITVYPAEPVSATPGLSITAFGVL